MKKINGKAVGMIVVMTLWYLVILSACSAVTGDAGAKTDGNAWGVVGGGSGTENLVGASDVLTFGSHSEHKAFRFVQNVEDLGKSTSINGVNFSDYDIWAVAGYKYLHNVVSDVNFNQVKQALSKYVDLLKTKGFTEINFDGVTLSDISIIRVFYRSEDSTIIITRLTDLDGLSAFEFAGEPIILDIDVFSGDFYGVYGKIVELNRSKN